ncbi:MAG: glycosyltransferase family 4 protein [Capsulimonadales bacterium]|nr:glycosyltransferase family 4 protein [Capsulimonadales bacterium]
MSIKIALVAHYLPPNGWGGVENYTVLVGKALAKRGHSVCLYARGTRTDVPEGFEETDHRFGDGIEVTESHRGGGELRTERRLRLLQSDRFAAFLERTRPDVVHFQHLLYHSIDFPAQAKRAGAAVVLTIHDFWFDCPTVLRVDHTGAICDRVAGSNCLPCLWGGRKSRVLPAATLATLMRTPGLRVLTDLHPYIDELENWPRNSERSLRSVDIAISPSRWVAENLAAKGISGPRLRVLDNGVAKPTDGTGDSPRSADGVLRFGLIATHPLKGGAVAVEAFRRLEGRPVRLLLFGKPPDGPLPSNVVVEGRYGREETDRVFRSFDVLIVPSLWYENAPLVIREAFARKRPVIASAIGGMKESVREGVDGLLFPVGDAGALAECVRRIADEPGLHTNLRAGIRPPIFEEEHVNELVEIYRQALRSRREE